MDKSQSLFLAAVILGSQKPNPPGVLRSTLYSPIPVFQDYSHSIVELSVERFNITQVIINVSDTTQSTAVIEVIKTIAAKPEAFDVAVSNCTLSVALSKVIRDTSTKDVVGNTATLQVTHYDAVRAYVSDSAVSTVTLGVTKV